MIFLVRLLKVDTVVSWDPWAHDEENPDHYVIERVRHGLRSLTDLQHVRTFVQSSVLTRYVRSAFVEVLGEDYYRTARAIGWTRGAAMLRHGLRNASLSLVTVLGLQLASVLVGAIVIGIF